MAVSKKQRQRTKAICQCGCNEIFYPFPTYPKDENGNLRVAKYKRGHHPKSLKGSRKNFSAWNKGLKKGDHPSIERMGYQVGHKPYNNWDHVNKALNDDPELRAKWLKSKKGQVPWNKGLKKTDYPNGIASGEDHGNWKGGRSGIAGTAEYAEFRENVLKRDNYTCQHCGDKNRKGRGSRINLEVHHIQSLAQYPLLAMDFNNVITLCRNCHYKTHNYGAKNIGNKSSGN